MASLTIVSGANAGRSYELNDRELVIGRDPMCEIVVPVRTVSRQHARVGANAGGFYVEDLSSVNGTFINGKKLEGRASLENQDRIRIGQNVFQLFEANADDLTVMVDPSALKGESSSKVEKDSPKSEDNEGDDSRMPRIVSSMDAGASQIGVSINPQEKLKAILDIAQSLGSSLDLNDVLPKILDSLFRIFPQTSHGYILQAPRVGAQLEPIAIKHRNSDSDTISPIGGPIVSRVMTEGAAFLSSPNDDGDSVFDDPGPISVMCAPLMGPSKTPLGVIHLDTNDAKSPFTQGDLEMLIAVATVAGQSVEYARMHADILELDRQKRDLATAQDVQLHFLPDQPPAVEGYSFYDYYRAAATVAGDYYDYIPLPDGRLAIAMGDVAGKGVPAALLMARLCSDVRYSLLTHKSAAEAVNSLNKQLAGHLRPGRFITFVLFLLDPVAHKISIVNAGHTPPLLRRNRDRSIERVAAGDKAEIPLGISSDVVYPQSDLALAPGDIVLTYTDGVNEATDADGNMYGNVRVHELLSTAPEDATHVGQALVADVRSFSGGLRQSDDICLLCFGRSK